MDKGGPRAPTSSLSSMMREGNPVTETIMLNFYLSESVLIYLAHQRGVGGGSSRLRKISPPLDTIVLLAGWHRLQLIQFGYKDLLMAKARPQKLRIRSLDILNSALRCARTALWSTDIYATLSTSTACRYFSGD